ncbi:DNA cytosine methyltransferase [Demequina globuliformis]|uniref:DNA cytosine methyltransferase n=1 Tax=Demequina globuliformis TaxID=676202 RepID=UPI0007848058|nr:DNA cytosine methyltransferase [Demequina globuliformis]
MLTSVDLFAGAGGLSHGLSHAGFATVYANEVVPQYAETYAANHPLAIVESRDIRDVDAAQVRRKVGLGVGELDLVAGGPPCQGFSINAPTRSGDDRRNHLFREYLRFVEEFQPKRVLIENVPGLVSFEGGSTLAAILQSLQDLGYRADVRILYAANYGVPQTRWRTFILAGKDLADPTELFPRPTHQGPVRANFTSKFRGRPLVEKEAEADLPRFVTVREALSDLPPLANGEATQDGAPYASEPTTKYQSEMRDASAGVLNHAAPRLGAVNLARLRHIPPGGNWTDIPFEMLPAGMKRARRSDHTKRYGRVNPDGLASTILTKCDPHWGAYFHYAQDRVFTVREAARIQSFPDSYVFLGSRADQYEQVGNAVPPKLAAAVGFALRTTLKQGIEAHAELEHS